MKARLFFLGLAMFFTQTNGWGMDLDRAYVKDFIQGKSYEIHFDGTLEGLHRSFAQKVGRREETFMLLASGTAIPREGRRNLSHITTLIATPVIKPIKTIGEITDGKDAYKQVTDRAKRKLEVFQTNHKLFWENFNAQKYAACAEPLLQYNVALDDVSNMYTLTPLNRAEVLGLITHTCKFDPKILESAHEKKLLEVVSRINAEGSSKARGMNESIFNFNENIRYFSPTVAKKYVEDIETFFRDNVMRSYVLASLVYNYTQKHPDQPVGDAYINRHCLDNLALGEQAEANDWLPCPLTVAETVVKEHNEDAGTTGETFGALVTRVRAKLKEIGEMKN